MYYYKGPKAKTFYALEGAVSNAGYGVSWLKDNMLLNTDIVKKPASATPQSYFGDSAVLSSYNSNSTLFETNSVSNKTDVVFGKLNYIFMLLLCVSFNFIYFFQFHHLADFIHHIGSTIPEGKRDFLVSLIID